MASDDDVTARSVRAGAITGMSAVLVPYTADGAIDWANVEAHVARTRDAGLTPAVNMDTGYVQLLAPDDRERVLDLDRSVSPAATSWPARTWPTTPAHRSTSTRTSRAADAIASRGGTPVIFPSHGLNALDRRRRGSTRTPRLAARARPVHRLRARCDVRAVRPHRRPRRVPRADGDPAVHRREALVAQPAARSGTGSRCATRSGPDFHVFTGNDLAIDMVMYGSDYLLGLSTFAPEEFARRDRMWADGDPGVPRAQRRAAVPRRVHVPRPGARVPPRRGDVVRAPRLGRERRDAARRAPPARRRPRRALDARRAARRARRARASRERPLPAGEAARHGRRRCAPASTELGVDDASRSPTPSIPPARSPRRSTFTDGAAGTLHRAEPVRGPADGGLGRHRRPARRPTSCAGGGTASRASGCGLVWGEATAVRPDGRANPHQLVLDETHRRRHRRAARPARSRAGRRAPAHPLGPLVPARRRRPRRAPRTRTRCSTRASAPTPATPFTDAELDELADDYVDAAVLAAEAGFDFVDVKHCHGYLLHELLGAHDRPGRVRRRPRRPHALPPHRRRRHPRPRARARDRGAALGVRPRAVRRPAPTAAASPRPTVRTAYAFGGDGDRPRASTSPRRTRSAPRSPSSASGS